MFPNDLSDYTSQYPQYSIILFLNERLIYTRERRGKKKEREKINLVSFLFPVKYFFFLLKNDHLI